MIDIKDEFCLMDVRGRKNYNVKGDEVINDLKVVFMVVDSTPEVFMIKDYGSLNDFEKISYTGKAIAKFKQKEVLLDIIKAKHLVHEIYA